MRYQLIANEDRRGMVLRPDRTGGVTAKGELWDGGYDLVVETGKSFRHIPWERLVRLAAQKGYVEVPNRGAR